MPSAILITEVSHSASSPHLKRTSSSPSLGGAHAQLEVFIASVAFRFVFFFTVAPWGSVKPSVISNKCCSIQDASIQIFRSEKYAISSTSASLPFKGSLNKQDSLDNTPTLFLFDKYLLLQKKNYFLSGKSPSPDQQSWEIGFWLNWVPQKCNCFTHKISVL